MIFNIHGLRSQEMSILSMPPSIQSLLKPVVCLPIIFRLALTGLGGCFCCCCWLLLCLVGFIWFGLVRFGAVWFGCWCFLRYFFHFLWLDPLWQFPNIAAVIFVMSWRSKALFSPYWLLFSCPFLTAGHHQAPVHGGWIDLPTRRIVFMINVEKFVR